MPRISVVVPIYDVEMYLSECLRSLAAQTTRDLEVVMVDDGSSDDSAAIAERFAARDRRFRLITQANAGLGHARNTGVAAAGGELLAFVDSDDVVPGDAYELLAASLDATGSDFASGNVLRLEDGRTSQAPFVARTFARTRPRTHVTRFQPLLSDRIACNKLWRRAFWDANALRFPEGVLHEDIPVTLPAHVMAGAVDVLAEPVYQYRIRADGASITQKRLEMRALVDRLAAVEHVRGYLAQHAPRSLRRRYDERLVRDDLRLHLNLLADADDAYRTCFVERVTVLLASARGSLFADLPAIDRLKWHLVLGQRTDELVEVLRFEQERKATTAPLRRRGRWYGDYPFRRDRELNVPRSVYRLGKPDAELSLRATVEELACADGRLVVRGHAHLAGLPVQSPADQRVQLLAVRPGPWQRLRMRATAVRAPARTVKRPDLGADAATGALDRRWAGFEAELSPATLGRRGRAATWQLCVYVRTRGLRRRFVRFDLDDVASAQLPAGPGLMARAVACPSGHIELQVRDRWVSARNWDIVDGDVLELTGTLRLAADATPAELEVRRAGDGWCTQVPLVRADDAFTARLPLSQLHLAPPDEAGDEALWQLSVTGAGRRVPLALPGASPVLRWWSSGHEQTLVRTLAGDAAIADRDARPLIAAAAWTGADRLELDVRLRDGLAERELVLMDWHRKRAQAFPLLPGEEEGAFRAIIPAGELLQVPAGLTPRRGEWRFYGRPVGSVELPAMARVRLSDTLTDAFPLATMLDERTFTLGAAPDGSLMLSVPERSAVPARARGVRGSARAGANATGPAG